METIEYRYVDKSDWGAGPWQNECDKRQWTDEATGLPCLIVRGPHGALCGYVGVAEGHPWHGLSYSSCDSDAPRVAADYDASPEAITEVHSGLTFSAFCAEGEPEHGICHRPSPGEPERVWWFGFDCAHAGDFTPGSEARYRSIVSAERYAEQARVLGLGAPTGWGTVIEYRSVEYVAAECASLASQLAALAPRLDPTTQPVCQDGRGR